MKIRKSTALLGAVCIVIASLFGLQKGLALLLLCMGFRESLRAKLYYDNKEIKLATVKLHSGVCIRLGLSPADLKFHPALMPGFGPLYGSGQPVVFPELLAFIFEAAFLVGHIAPAVVILCAGLFPGLFAFNHSGIQVEGHLADGSLIAPRVRQEQLENLEIGRASCRERV